MVGTNTSESAICDVECYNGLHSSEEEVEYLVLTSANTTMVSLRLRRGTVIRLAEVVTLR